MAISFAASRIVVGAVTMMAAAFAGSLTASAATCATRAEIEAHQIRHLQSRLVVAALSCGQQHAYNTFVSRFKPDLAVHGQQLIGYYGKAKGGTDALNSAVTALANAASKLRAEDPQGFCTATWNLFWALERKPEQLADAAAGSLMYAVPMPSLCQDPPVVSADSNPNPGRGPARAVDTTSRSVPVK